MDANTRSTLGFTTECWFRFPANAANLSPLACSTTTTLPVVVRTSLSMTVYDPLLLAMLGSERGSLGLPIITQVSMRYAGR